MGKKYGSTNATLKNNSFSAKKCENNIQISISYKRKFNIEQTPLSVFDQLTYFS